MDGDDWTIKGDTMGSTSIGAGPPAGKPAAQNHAAHKHHNHGADVSKVARAKGGAAAPAKTDAPPATAKGVAQEASKVAGATGDAVGGVAQIKGGGPSGDMGAILQSLQEMISKLSELIKSMAAQVGGANGGGPAGKGDGCGCGGSAVKGASGGAATLKQFVAPVAAPLVHTNQKSEDSDYEQKVLDLVNEERRKAGLRPLSYNAVLDNAAEKHNVQQERTGRMAHDGIGDGDPGSRIRAEGFRNAWGENVAVGQTTPEQVVREWMASPGHRANILNPNFTTLGVAHGTGANGRPFWAQSFGA